MPGRSCVPAGTYQLETHNSETHPHSFALVNPALGVSHWDAPGMRSLVLIHAANYVEELRGCIALGLGRAAISPNQWMLRDSRAALEKFKELVPWTNGHTIELIERT